MEVSDKPRPATVLNILSRENQKHLLLVPSVFGLLTKTHISHLTFRISPEGRHGHSQIRKIGQQFKYSSKGHKARVRTKV